MQATRLNQLLSHDAASRLVAFKSDIFRALAGFVEDVVLFGSRARGDAEEDSDYHLAVLLKDRMADDPEIFRRISDIAWDHLDGGSFLQVLPLNADAFEPSAAGHTELIMRIAAEGVSIR